VDPDREWWLRVPAVLLSPRAVFTALRNEERDDLDARSEPVLALVLLAGVFAALTSGAARTLYDDPVYDGPLVVALWVVFAAVFIAFVSYFVVGGALYLGARGMGSEGTFRRARHVLAFATTPLTVAVLVLWPIELLLFGDDLFRRGGDDEGTAGTVFDVLELAFAAWAAVLLVVGVRAVHGWSWWRSLGALGLVTLFLAAFKTLPSVLG
jgi:hypothetical protein